ncbi:hypothetical protein E3U41_04765 [Brevundimonas naejangsanensis]|nr:hypothetical protein E3U41_04765 [Brevundimonas naejangsanensis]
MAFASVASYVGGYGHARAHPRLPHRPPRAGPGRGRRPPRSRRGPHPRRDRHRRDHDRRPGRGLLRQGARG